MYLRFVQARIVEGMHAREGFFGAAYHALASNDIDRHTAEQVEQMLDWFKENLDTPDRFSRNRAKEARLENTRGLSWFKPDATDHTRKAFELMALLNDNGYPVELLRTTRPGYIVYEDAVQIVADPFSDTPV